MKSGGFGFSLGGEVALSLGHLLSGLILPRVSHEFFTSCSLSAAG